MVMASSEIKRGITEQEQRAWWILISTSSILVFYILTSSTIVVALPFISADFNADIATISWVSIIFYTVHSALMPVMGHTGDLYGRKKTFIVGTIIFTATSVLCALAWNVESLVFARGLMAVGTAALPPMALALVFSAFPGERRALALGIMAGIMGIAPSAGPLLGGLLIDAGNQLDWLQWRIIFWINLPLAALLIPLAMVFLKETEPSPEGRSFDILGAILLVAGLASLVLALNQGASWGWSSAATLGLMAASASALAIFLLWELRCDVPLVDLSLFRYRSLVTANICGFLIVGALFSMMLVLPFYYQSVLELSAFWIGLALAPIGIAFALFSPAGGALTQRFGSRTTLILGLLVSGGGYLLVSQALSFDQPQVEAAVSVTMAAAVVGAGIGLTSAPIDNTALLDVPDHKRGLAAALPNMSRTFGGAIAIALMSSFVSWRLTERLIGAGVPADEAAAFTGTSEQSLSLTYKEAATQAYHDTCLFTIVFIVLALVAAAFMTQVRAKNERNDER